MRFAFLACLILAMLAGSAHAATDTSSREFQECVNCPVMVGIPAGSFVMGSPASEPGRFDAEGPQHRVTIRAFALGKFDITNEEFAAFLKATGYQPKPCNAMLDTQWQSPGDHLAYPPSGVQPRRWPATCLDWNDATAYIAWLNKMVRAARPEIGDRAGPYRLPSEAEWEYAARGGTTTARWWGNDVGVGHAVCNGCGSAVDDSQLSDVDAFSPNPFGLYGMLGNVWQWTADCWHPSYVGAPSDGRAWTSGDCAKHVLRGGSWDNVPVFVRSAARSAGSPDGGEYDYSSLAGFRVARDLP